MKRSNFIKVFLSSIILSGIILFSGCSGSVVYSRLSNESERTIPLVLKDYDVIGYIRVEAEAESKETSYDELLALARAKYKDDKIDIINLKEDSSSKTFNSKSFETTVLINALVIKYK